MGFQGQDPKQLVESGEFEDSDASIKCPNCEAEASLYAYKYDPELNILVCGSCSLHEWANDAGSKSTARKCPICQDYVTDADVSSAKSVACAARGHDDESSCDQLAHRDCADTCTQCGWLCENESGYPTCDSCGLTHFDDHFVSFGRDFVDQFGHICMSCFSDDEDAYEPERDLDPALVGTVDEEPPEEINASPDSVEAEIGFERKRQDQSAYLSHFIRCKGEMDDDACCQQLIDILNSKKLEARPTGYFSTYNQIPSKTALSKAVCFTEGRLPALVDHAKSYSGFGLSFSKFFLLKNKGAAPAIYIHNDIMKEARANIPDKLVPFVNLVSADGYNFQHEREWRIPTDFDFKLKDVRHIFAPIRYHQRLRDILGQEFQIVCLESLENI